ncbi:ER membrane protein complex subunit 1 [Auxenochlorella protothecoides]|uniref:ER membrane protein complex subunit 1 n=1 Tax=Auxenochlorella protothecoides TaxID=3075 RepID=A0A087SKD3_AUXPR|nr:ER membrane protein complex subunit 1 [Auxenochlorella protothecoides]KFM26187.1 ER membrane protein complex subunit 1 [Auxenochlorella protothecoides]
MLTLINPSAHALLESQASKYSWLLQNVGTVTDADLGQHLITLSEQGVLASLSPGDGRLLWRKVLSPGARLVSGPGVAVAIEPARVLAFAATNGALLWERPAVEADVAFTANGRLVLTAQDAVHVLAASNGVVVASSKVHVDGEEPSEARPSVHSAGADAATALLAIWAPIRRALVVLQLDSSSGALTQIASHALPAKVQVDLDPAAVAFLAGSRLLAVTADGSTLCHAETQGDAPLSCEAQRTADARPLSGFRLLKVRPCGAYPALPVQTPDGLALFAYQRGALGAIAFVPGGVGAACALDAAGQASAAVLVEGDPLSGPGAARVDFLNPADGGHEAAWLAARPGTLQALRAQLLLLKAQAGFGSAEEAAEVAAFQHATDDRLRPFRDADGFRKQILVLTEHGWGREGGRGFGKLVSLHSSDGHVLWTLTLPRSGALTFRRVLMWREPHTLHGELEVVVLAEGASGGAACVVDAYSGRLAATLPLPGGMRSWAPLPAPVAEADASSFVYLGVPLDPAAPAPVLAVARSASRPNAPGPFAKAFGGVDVRYRYLNPSLTLVATGASAGTGPGADGSVPPLTVHLLDGVTGRTLWSASHEGGRGPVRAVVADNWAAYHFWSAAAGRWQVGVVELYEAGERRVSVAQLALAGPPNSTLPARRPPALEAYAASYHTKLAAAALGVTRTAHGTTAPQLLLGTTGGQVYMLDRRLLDPRRPVVDKPTPGMLAEGLAPYASELPLAGGAFATRGARVARLADLLADPATLESSSLLLARGLDLYGARLAPSATFDQVPDDFPYALLVLIVLGMGSGAAALRRLSARRAVNRLWE